MQRTADFHNQVADYHLPEPAGVVDNPAALDAAIDVLDVHAATTAALGILFQWGYSRWGCRKVNAYADDLGRLVLQ